MHCSPIGYPCRPSGRLLSLRPCRQECCEDSPERLLGIAVFRPPVQVNRKAYHTAMDWSVLVVARTTSCSSSVVSIAGCERPPELRHGKPGTSLFILCSYYKAQCSRLRITQGIIACPVRSEPGMHAGFLPRRKLYLKRFLGQQEL